jgi:hypothetical protein
VEVEVLGLFGEDALGLVGKFFATFDCLLAGFVEGGLAGEGAKNVEPAGRVFVQGLECGAEVGLAVGVLVDVVAKLIEEGGEVLQFVVEVLCAGRGLGAVGEAFDDFSVLVEEFGVKGDAGGGIDAGVANLLDLGFGEGLALFFLGDEAGGQ